MICDNKTSSYAKHLSAGADEWSDSSDNSPALNLVRSIVDELYRINTQQTSADLESKGKRVRFTFGQEADETALRTYQPMLAESSTVICCSIPGRSKVDCSVSTDDLFSPACENATQTTDATVDSQCSYSLATEQDVDRDQSEIGYTASTIWMPSNDTPIICHDSVALNRTLYSCGNTAVLPSSIAAQQLILPSKARCYDMYEEQTDITYETLLNSEISPFASSSIRHNDDTIVECNRTSSEKDIVETDVKLCRCSKRQRSTTDLPKAKLLEELRLSKRSLQSMHDDGLFYTHDLVLMFLQRSSQFEQLLHERYHLSKKQANVFFQLLNQQWTTYQADFINIKNKALKR